MLVLSKQHSGTVTYSKTEDAFERCVNLVAKVINLFIPENWVS